REGTTRSLHHAVRNVRRSPVGRDVDPPGALRSAPRLRARVLAPGPRESPLPADWARRGARARSDPCPLPGSRRAAEVLPQLRGAILPARALRTKARRDGGARAARVARDDARRMGGPDPGQGRRARVRRGERVNLADVVRDAALANPAKPALVFQ